MIRCLTLEEVLELHRLVLAQSGGLEGIQDIGGVDSALTQPQMTLSGQELHPKLAEKAVALGGSLWCATIPSRTGTSALDTPRWKHF